MHIQVALPPVLRAHLNGRLRRLELRLDVLPVMVHFHLESSAHGEMRHNGLHGLVVGGGERGMASKEGGEPADQKVPVSSGS